MGGGLPDLGSLGDYGNQPITPDVGGGGLDLGSLFGQGGGGGGVPGLGSIGDLFSGISSLTQGGAGNDLKGALDITALLAQFIPVVGPALSAALPMIGNLIGPMIQGLPANVKPDMFADYLKSQGGIAGDLGNLISNAQQAAGSGSGVLSQKGAGAYNPEFESGLLEALTGQSMGSQTAPPSGGAKHGVTMNFNPAANILQQLGLGSGGAGYTAQELSTPAATKAIMSATKGGKVGTGQKMGAKKIQQYLPAVEKALAAAGIYPGGGGGGGGGGGSSTGTGDGSGGGGGDTSGGGGSTGVGNGGDYLNQPKGSDNPNLPDLTGLLKLLGKLIPGLDTSGGGTGVGIGQGGAGGSATATSNPTININQPASKPWLQAAGGFTNPLPYNPLPKV